MNKYNVKSRGLKDKSCFFFLFVWTITNSRGMIPPHVKIRYFTVKKAMLNIIRYFSVHVKTDYILIAACLSAPGLLSSRRSGCL